MIYKLERMYPDSDIISIRYNNRSIGWIEGLGEDKYCLLLNVIFNSDDIALNGDGRVQLEGVDVV
jgi:hypothetical protein